VKKQAQMRHTFTILCLNQAYGRLQRGGGAMHGTNIVDRG